MQHITKDVEDIENHAASRVLHSTRSTPVAKAPGLEQVRYDAVGRSVYRSICRVVE